MSTLTCIFKLKITAQQMYTLHYAVTKEKLGRALTSIFFCFALNLAFNFYLSIFSGQITELQKARLMRLASGQ